MARVQPKGGREGHRCLYRYKLLLLFLFFKIMFHGCRVKFGGYIINVRCAKRTKIGLSTTDKFS